MPTLTFAAIDFETANFERSSAISVGMAIVKCSRLVATYSSLIKPRFPNNYFEPEFCKKHGLYPSDVRRAPTFDKVVRNGLLPLLRRHDIRYFVAHNAKFDRAVLMQSYADAYRPDASYADINGQTGGKRALLGPMFVCTLRIARKHLRSPGAIGLQPINGHYNVRNHKLNTLCEFFDVPLNHHNALSDAKATAELYLRLHNTFDVQFESVGDFKATEAFN